MFAGLVAVIVTLTMIIAGPATVASWFGAGKASSQPSVPGGSAATEKSEDEDSATQENVQPETPKPGPCLPGKLAVEAVTDAEEYGPDAYPELSLRVTNHSEVACDADLGTATMVFEVKSGEELYWKSTDCQAESSKNLVRMEPGQTLETDVVVWDRTRSSPDTCEDERDQVPAGGSSYHLTVEIAETTSQNTRQFLLY